MLKLIFIIVLVLIIPVLPQASSWNQFHGDATHSGYADLGPGVSYFGTPRFVVGSNLFDYSSPCVCNGKIFAYGFITNTSGDTIAAKIVAFNENNGDSIWATPIANAIWGSWSSPAADPVSNSVYIASSDTIYRIEANSGTIVWRSKTKDVIVNASPTINTDDSLVYIHAYAGYEPITFLQAFRLSDGILMWSDSLQGQGQTSVAYDAQGSKVYTTLNTGGYNDPGTIGAFDAITGDTIWISDSTYAHPCYGGIVFDSTRGIVVAGGFNYFSPSSMLILNASDGSYIIEIENVPSGDYTAAVGDSLIYVCGREGTFGIEPNTGEIVWNFSRAASWASSACYAADNGTGQTVVYVGGDTSYTVNGKDTLYMLDAIDGTVLATFQTEGGGTPAIENGNIYFMCGGSLVALGPSVSIKELANNSRRQYMSRNYPNPFRDKTVITFSIGHSDRKTHSSYGTGSAKSIELKIYDVSGRIVKVFNLVSGILPLTSSVCWDGKDDKGKALPNGIYMYMLKIDGATETGKMLMLK
ncbi:PQQ-binding-like beta-propeller repeat protein [candidate division WOR-3 bacterium]|nr:PQQ-binding-like beta-propeller repeat protein [candidate division WOR-3 bacterium]